MKRMYAHLRIHILTDQVLTITLNFTASTFKTSRKETLKTGVKYEIAFWNEAQVGEVIRVVANNYRGRRENQARGQNISHNASPASLPLIKPVRDDSSFSACDSTLETEDTDTGQPGKKADTNSI